MAKDEKNYSKDLKKLFSLATVTLILTLFSCILGIINISAYKKSKEAVDYDVSMMRQVGVQDVLKMFDDGKTHVLYIGRETCDVCVELLPVLQQAQIDMNFVTQYMDITEITRSGDAWNSLVDKLDVELTTTVDGKSVTNTYGYFLNSKGFTPCIILIKDGKQVDGFIGSKKLTSYEDWLGSYGI